VDTDGYVKPQKVPVIGMKTKKDVKFLWSSSIKVPVCGTTLVVEIDKDMNDLKVIGTQQAQFVLDRKHM
jgi:hypothetical protein